VLGFALPLLALATGAGLPALIEAIRTRVIGRPVAGQLDLGPEHSRIRAKLFSWHAVRREQERPAGGWTIDVELSARRWRELSQLEGLNSDSMRQKA